MTNNYLHEKVLFLSERENPRAFVLGLLEGNLRSLEIYAASEDGNAQGSKSAIEISLEWIDALKIVERTKGV